MTYFFNVLQNNMLPSLACSQTQPHSRVFDKLLSNFDEDVAKELDGKIVAAIMAAPITRDGMIATLELSMPEFDGLFLTKIIRQHGNNITFV